MKASLSLRLCLKTSRANRRCRLKLTTNTARPIKAAMRRGVRTRRLGCPGVRCASGAESSMRHLDRTAADQASLPTYGDRRGHFRTGRYRSSRVPKRGARTLPSSSPAAAHKGVRRPLGRLRARLRPDGPEPRHAGTLLVLHTRTRASVRNAARCEKLAIPRRLSERMNDSLAVDLRRPRA